MNKQFEKWVKNNCLCYRRLKSPPTDYDSSKEFFYKIDDYQYRVKIQDLPERFKKILFIK